MVVLLVFACCTPKDNTFLILAGIITLIVGLVMITITLSYALRKDPSLSYYNDYVTILRTYRRQLPSTEVWVAVGDVRMPNGEVKTYQLANQNYLCTATWGYLNYKAYLVCGYYAPWRWYGGGFGVFFLFSLLLVGIFFFCCFPLLLLEPSSSSHRHQDSRSRKEVSNVDQKPLLEKDEQDFDESVKMKPLRDDAKVVEKEDLIN